MIEKCPKCGIEGEMRDDRSLLVTDSEPRGIHRFGGIDCLRTQLATAEELRNKAIDALAEAMSGLQDEGEKLATALARVEELEKEQAVTKCKTTELWAVISGYRKARKETPNEA